MSGGVDSSVAAWLLREQGHDVVGLFMRHGVAVDPAPDSYSTFRRCVLPAAVIYSFADATSPAADSVAARLVVRVADPLHFRESSYGHPPLPVVPGAFSLIQRPPCFPERKAASHRTFQSVRGI